MLSVMAHFNKPTKLCGRLILSSATQDCAPVASTSSFIRDLPPTRFIRVSSRAFAANNSALLQSTARSAKGHGDAYRSAEKLRDLKRSRRPFVKGPLDRMCPIKLTYLLPSGANSQSCVLEAEPAVDRCGWGLSKILQKDQVLQVVSESVQGIRDCAKVRQAFQWIAIFQQASTSGIIDERIVHPLAHFV